MAGPHDPLACGDSTGAGMVPRERGLLGMKRSIVSLSGVLLLLAVAGLLSGCPKTDEDEMRVEVIDGDDEEVTLLVGISANPKKAAADFCGLYGKQAVFRDLEPAGTQFEAYATGSRYYLYYFDCI